MIMVSSLLESQELHLFTICFFDVFNRLTDRFYRSSEVKQGNHNSNKTDFRSLNTGSVWHHVLSSARNCMLHRVARAMLTDHAEHGREPKPVWHRAGSLFVLENVFRKPGSILFANNMEHM